MYAPPNAPYYAPPGWAVHIEGRLKEIESGANDFFKKIRACLEACKESITTDQKSSLSRLEKKMAGLESAIQAQAPSGEHAKLRERATRDMIERTRELPETMEAMKSLPRQALELQQQILGQPLTVEAVEAPLQSAMARGLPSVLAKPLYDSMEATLPGFMEESMREGAAVGDEKTGA